MPLATQHLRDLLLPELEAELQKTRRMLERVPEGRNDFKPHERSMTLLALTNHVATVAGYGAIVLGLPSLEVGSPGDPRVIVREATSAGALGQFGTLAEKSLAALRTAEDDSFYAPWTLTRGDQTIFSGTRYGAYQNIGLHHLVHHRAQLGVYLRLLDVPVPSTFGPTADEK